MCKQARRAEQLFLGGMNCAQATAAAFAEETGAEDSLLLKLATGFGGGIAGRRETCGAVTGMLLAAGLLFGYDGRPAAEEKAAVTARMNELMVRFEERCGCTRCGDLLERMEPATERREYCAGLVFAAARILAEDADL